MNQRVQPLCPVFGQCGGCLYQDISYEEELKNKEGTLKELLQTKLTLKPNILEQIIPSPKSYYYRNGLDLRLVRTKNRDVLMGFSPGGRRKSVISVEACHIADKNISDYIPLLKEEARKRLLPRSKEANVVVRTGDSGNIRWGGIGRRSLQLKEEDYLWTQIRNKKIFYSLDTFFQTNLSILSSVFERLEALEVLSKETIFFDLYSGVGLFGIVFSDIVKKVILIEECVASVKLARYNVNVNQLKNVETIEGRVEEKLSSALDREALSENVAFIDPPRAGLSEKALNVLKEAKTFKHILYLSCGPENLARDLAEFVSSGWQIEKIIPFDFFPKTKRLEVLAVLNNGLA